MRAPLAPLARLEVVLEVAVAGGDRSDRLDGRGGKGSAAEVGVDDDPGGIDHGAQARHAQPAGARLGGVHELRLRRRPLAGEHGPPRLAQLLACGGDRAAVGRGDRPGEAID